VNRPCVYVDVDYRCSSCDSTMLKLYNHPESYEMRIQCTFSGCPLAERELIVKRTKLELEYRYPHLYEDEQ
jgi:hypothetical protein